MSRVHHLERLNGVDVRLCEFANWWDAHGPFHVTIPPTGAVRLSQIDQAALFLAGASKARTLEETPHGRGGAVDFYPAVMDSTGRIVKAIHMDTSIVEVRDMFGQLGLIAESWSLQWGGRFEPISDETGLGWDPAHCQLPDWRDIPYPPILTV